MIDRLTRIISLVPDNSHFGKLTGILAMLYTKKYMDSFGNLQDLTNDDIIWLNSILFFNKNTNEEPSVVPINGIANPNTT